ncbi:MAG: T9SS type A sorting domain-containing protein, partial [Bacteroidota bacterium]
LLSVKTYAQAPNWLWTKSANGVAPNYKQGITKDTNGNVYITGNFSTPTITFGSIVLTNAGGFDIYIVKYNSDGNVVWAKNAGGTGYDIGESITIDISGNVIITGQFSSPTLTFGSTVLTPSGFSNYFIAKYDSSGNPIWAKGATVSTNSSGNNVTTDNFGNIYVTGEYRNSSIDFGSGLLTNSGFSDFFLLKYSPSGILLWSKNNGGASYEQGECVKTDDNGNVYVTGFFYSSVITFDTVNLTNAGPTTTPDVFLNKYDSSGNIIWSKRAGGNNADYARQIQIDGSGNIILVGHFISMTVTFGSTTLSSLGGNDILVLKYDNLGNIVWAKSSGGAEFDYALGVDIDMYNNIYVGGEFASTSITLDTITLNNNDTFVNTYDCFVTKIDSLGNIVWAKSYGGIDNDYLGEIVTEDNGDLYSTGYFGSDTLNFGNTNLVLTGVLNVYTAKLSDFTTDIVSKESFSKLQVYPNPAKDKLTITDLAQGSQLTIYNSIGQLVVQLSNSQSQTIDISKLEKGIY